MLLQRFELKRLFLTSVLAVGLSACGGGDGDGDGGNVGGGPSALTVNIPAVPLALVEANADAVAGEAFATATDGGAVPPVTFSASGSASQAQVWSPVRAADFGLQKFKSARPAGSEFVANSGPVANVVQQCSGGGQVDVIDNGSSGSLSFASCIEGGTVINGVVLVSNIVDNAPTQTSVTMVFQGFSITEGPNFIAVQGDISMSETTVAGVTTSTVSGSNFASQFNSEGFRLTNYNISNVYDPGPPAMYTDSANFTYASTSLGGQVTVQTLEDFVTDAGDQYPSSGQALATGSNGSKCRLTVVNNVNVTLEVDADGDGVYETTIDTTWAAIDAAS